MGKGDRKKKNNEKIAIRNNDQVKAVAPPSVSWKKIKTIFTWLLLIGIPTALTYWGCFKGMKEDAKTPHEKRMSSGYVQGIMLPYRHEGDQVVFRFGELSVHYSVSEFREWLNPFAAVGHMDVSFETKKIGNKLYSRVFLMDKYGEQLGKINGETYEFTQDIEKVDFDEGNDFIEVVDRDRQVLFQMKYEPPNVYYVQGYFHRDSTIYYSGGGGIYYVGTYNERGKFVLDSLLDRTEHFSPRWKNGYRSY